MLAFLQNNVLEPAHIPYPIFFSNMELPDTAVNRYQIQWILYTNAHIIIVQILAPRAGRTGKHHLLLRMSPWPDSLSAMPATNLTLRPPASLESVLGSVFSVFPSLCLFISLFCLSLYLSLFSLVNRLAYILKSILDH